MKSGFLKSVRHNLAESFACGCVLMLLVFIGWATQAHAAPPACADSYDIEKSGIVDVLKSIYGNGFNKFELRYPALDDTVQISIVGGDSHAPKVPLITPAGRELIERVEYSWFFFEPKRQGDPAIDVAFERCSGRAVGVLDPR